MTQANASETVSSGGIIATHTAASKEHQVFMQANADGHILGTTAKRLEFYKANDGPIKTQLAQYKRQGATIREVAA